MRVAIVRTTIDRKTGQELNQEVIGTEEIDKDKFYRPLVEVFGSRVLEAIRNSESMGNTDEKTKTNE